MELIEKEITVFGTKCTAKLMQFDKNDGIEWKKLFDLWKSLKIGMKNYKAREPNLPEGLSEVAFCLFSGSCRFIELRYKGVSSSFDTFNIVTNRAEQIKASSIDEDLTSFGPKSRWDDLYFMDFYNNGKLDGTFNVYKIPSELIYNHKVNAKQTMKEQQSEKRRPRFSITKDIIVKNNLKALATNVKVW